MQGFVRRKLDMYQCRVRPVSVPDPGGVVRQLFPLVGALRIRSEVGRGLAAFHQEHQKAKARGTGQAPQLADPAPLAHGVTGPLSCPRAMEGSRRVFQCDGKLGRQNVTLPDFVP